MIYRIFVEKKDNVQARKEQGDVKTLLGVQTEDFRLVLRYDVEGLTEEERHAFYRSLSIISNSLETICRHSESDAVAESQKGE